MMRYAKFLALAGAAVVAACTEARVAVPSDLASGTERLALSGIGGWQDGRFRLGSTEGRFSRRAGQTRWFNMLVESRGMVSFEAAGPEVGGNVNGWCGFSQGEIDASIAVLPNGRLTYRCRFDGAAGILRAQMFIAEVPYGSGLLAGRSRAGEIRVGDARVAVRAIHHAARGALPAGTPLGYSFAVDGRQIGAVDLNGSTKTIIAPRAPGPERDAVLLASIALGLFWDPDA